MALPTTRIILSISLEGIVSYYYVFLLKDGNRSARYDLQE